MRGRAATSPARALRQAPRDVEGGVEAAIVEVRRALLTRPALDNAREDRRKRIMDVLAQAGAAGVEGDHASCREKVAVARGKAGLG